MKLRLGAQILDRTMDKTLTDCLIIDIGVLGDKRIAEREIEKIQGYQDLKDDLQ